MSCVGAAGRAHSPDRAGRSALANATAIVGRRRSCCAADADDGGLAVSEEGLNHSILESFGRRGLRPSLRPFPPHPSLARWIGARAIHGARKRRIDRRFLEARQRSVRNRRVLALTGDQALAMLHRRVFFRRQSNQRVESRWYRQGTVHGRVKGDIERRLSGVSGAAGEASQVWQHCTNRLNSALADCWNTCDSGFSADCCRSHGWLRRQSKRTSD